ncbi:MAG TPA: EAL domain-containing protein [Burkholderiales bacterium]|nr:EAL domain-containing protein [Burkholderiales bacterium]
MRRRFVLVLAPILFIAGAMLLLVALSLEMFTAARAFVGAQGLWARGQRDAVYHLQAYAREGAERDYRAYREAMVVPLALRRARIALQQPRPDFELARRGLIEAGNHSQDVEAMVRFASTFRWLPQVSDVMRVWERADEQLARLEALAEAGRPAPAHIEAVRDGVQYAEAQFAALVNDSTRLMKRVLMWSLLAAAAALAALAVLVGRRNLGRQAAAEEAMRESEARMRLVANNVPALISYIDRDQRYRFSNRTYDDWFGVAHERMVGRTVGEVFGQDAYERMRGYIERVLAGESVEFEFGTAEGGRRRTLQVSCVPHLAPDGSVAGFYMLGNDVTALKRAQEDLRFAALQLQHDAQRLEFLAHHDTLTGVPNRAMFAERAREAVAHARRHDKRVAVLFLDLDNFKNVNDRLGHEIGDSLLKLIAARIRASVRGDDFVARIGGDEFCVLLQDIADAREAAAVAQKLVHEIGKPYRIGDMNVESGVSIGIACVPQDGEDVATLLRQADIAMYRAKELGRNGYQFFSGALNEDAAAAATLADELRAGMERGELYLVYQPRIDVATRQVVGAEALLRWRHPRLGVLTPESFLALADESGLLLPIGGWVLREACRQGRRWLDAGIRPMSVVVNVTGRQMRHGGLADQVAEALRESGIPPEMLLIEVPETTVRQVPEQIEQGLARVAASGARLGVDDFGTGYASLPMLQRLRVGAVCIDRRLVAGLPQDSEQAGLARALMALARGLGFDVVAKGVETHAQREFLVDAGCRVCQGDLFAAPALADEIEPFLRARRAA